MSLEYFTSVKLLTEHHLEFLSLKVDCRGSSESTLFKMSHCWKSHVTFPILFLSQRIDYYTEQEQAMVLSETQETHAHSHGLVGDKGENSLKPT